MRKIKCVPLQLGERAQIKVLTASVDIQWSKVEYIVHAPTMAREGMLWGIGVLYIYCLYI